jgi:hypothetical protein
MNPWLVRFFNLTAGLEKVIIGACTIVQTYIGTLEAIPANERALYIGLIGLVEILYTTNTTRQPVER